MTTKEEKLIIMQSFKDAEARVIAKIKARMIKLAKQPRLKVQMENEIKKELDAK